MLKLLFCLFCVICVTFACDIIVRLKSDTDKKFQAQIAAPNGRKSDKWTFSKKGERQTFQQRADECGLKDWEITTYENGKEISNKSRQGAICTGQCAPLASIQQKPTKKP
ncbi:unnamed protein product [Dracunculus medinensis]|uniref:DUF1080 domain-containing protein n=1 Tax=Dracunculus medinensis TaxID=318479 RepID=A0A0N4U126_DRAME|nr:unnamed protein product [Dracunculus medinensis]